MGAASVVWPLMGRVSIRGYLSLAFPRKELLTFISLGFLVSCTPCVDILFEPRTALAVFCALHTELPCQDQTFFYTLPSSMDDQAAQAHDPRYLLPGRWYRASMAWHSMTEVTEDIVDVTPWSRRLPQEQLPSAPFQAGCRKNGKGARGEKQALEESTL